MQHVTFNAPAGTPVNKWLTTRRNYLIRQLYALFARVHKGLIEQQEDSGFTLPPQIHQDLDELQTLSRILFSQNNPPEQQAKDLGWSIQALHHEAMQIHNGIELYQPQAPATARTSSCKTKQENISKDIKELYYLLDRTKHLLELLLVEQTGNDLLIRLLIEEELGPKLWQKPTTELFSAMFPYQPEVGYIMAGKSYFMGQWLEKSLAAYEQSLAITGDLAEPRRQTYLIRGMIRDRNKAKI